MGWWKLHRACTRLVGLGVACVSGLACGLPDELAIDGARCNVFYLPPLPGQPGVDADRGVAEGWARP